MDSILTTTKKLLGITEEYTHFDMDIIVFINTSLSKLTQLGVGPKNGFSIQDDTSVWSDFITPTELEMVKSFVYLDVRLAFDPPTTSHVATAMQKELDQLTWRISVAVS